MSAIRTKTVKVPWDGVRFPDAKNCNDGRMGKIAETHLQNCGFTVHPGSVIDLVEYQLEVKTRKSSSNAAHTVGTMTHNNILTHTWDMTSFKQKLQSQYRITIDVDMEEVSEAVVVHFGDDIDIQHDLATAYEEAREVLRNYYKEHGTICTDARIKKHKNSPAFLEYKDGNSYAFRITDAAMKKYIMMANRAESMRSLFE